MRVYGLSIEPGGMELDDQTITSDCPNCGKPALHRYWETCEGAINQRYSVNCQYCGHHSCNAERCDVCDSVEYDIPSLDELYSPDEDIKNVGVNNIVELLVYAAKIEGDFLVAQALFQLELVSKGWLAKLAARLFDEVELLARASYMTPKSLEVLDDIRQNLMRIQR